MRTSLSGVPSAGTRSAREQAAARDHGGTSTDPQPPRDASAQVRAYFAAMDAGDLARAAASFAEDAVYVRPVKTAGSTAGAPPARRLAVSRGRAEILRFVTEQDAAARAAGRTVRHELVTVICDGVHCSVVGIVPSSTGTDDVVFSAHAVLDAHGLISHYVATANESPTVVSEVLRAP